MKTILSILIVLMVFISCTERLAKHDTIYILNKKEYRTYVKGAGYKDYYKLYIYDGEKSKWYNTDVTTYNMYNVGDTINTLVLNTQP